MELGNYRFKSKKCSATEKQTQKLPTLNSGRKTKQTQQMYKLNELD